MNSSTIPLQALLIFVQTITLIILNFSCSKKSENTDQNQNARIGLKIKTVGPEAADLRGPILGDYSITPEVFKIDLTSISLANTGADTYTEIYNCKYPRTDCEVDLADTNSVAALEARLSSLEVTDGTYDKLVFSCSNGRIGPGGITLKGKVALANGEIVYTSDPANNSGSYVTSDASKAGEISVPAFGCSGSIPFSKPLVVGGDTSSPADAQIIPKGGFASLSLFTSIVGAVEYDDEPDISGLVSCTSLFTRPALAPGFCVRSPGAFVIFGETIATAEYYKLAGSKNPSDTLGVDDANVLLTTIQDSEGKTFGVSLFDFVSVTSPTQTSDDKGIFGLIGYPEFEVNSDSRLKLQFSEGLFPEFAREAHTAQILDYTYGNSTESPAVLTYRAFPFQP